MGRGKPQIISVDQGLEDIIKKFWSYGWITCNSCRGNQNKFVWIHLVNEASIDSIFKIVESAGKDHLDLYEYLWNNCSYHMVPIEYKGIYSHMSASIRFPSEDLDKFSRMFLRLA